MREMTLLLLFLIGLGLVVYGSWTIYGPAGYIAAGLLLAALVARYVRSGGPGA